MVKIMKKYQQAFTLIELMIVVAIIGILAAIAIPQYQTFVAKSQVARAIAEAGNAKVSVEECINRGNLTIGNASLNLCDVLLLPSSILVGDSQGDIVLDNTKEGVAQVVIAADGSAVITANFGHFASTVLIGKNITWTRNIQGSWVCASTADSKFNTAACP